MVGINEGAISAAEAAFGGIKVINTLLHEHMRLLGQTVLNFN